MNKTWLTYIQKISTFLNTNNLLEGLYYGNLYFDEPHCYYYSATIKNSKKYIEQNKLTSLDVLYSGGLSFFSPELAMLKCVSEAVERIAQESFNTEEIIYDTYTNNSSWAVNPALQIKDKKIYDELLGWKKGNNIVSGKEYLIPAQYVHYTYYSFRKETLLTQLISTGGATGWSHEQTLLEGMYEVIERDAFMTAYYIKAPVCRIEIDSIENKEIQHISNQLKRYNLTWYLFDMTNDLEIPVVTSVVVDKTGCGPAITVGASCSLDIEKNIIKSVSEAIMTRPWIRAYFNSATKTLFPTQKETHLIKSRIERAFYWYPQNSERKLSFWLDQSPKQLTKKTKFFPSQQAELEYVIKILSKKNYNYFFSDISHTCMKKYGFRIYKVIAPELHGLSLHEKKLFHNFERLHIVAKYFDMNAFTINTIPHPFL